jgi:hypothetical protein
MDWLNIISIPFVSLVAFIFGRNVWMWGLYAYFFGFWMFIPLVILPIRPRTEYTLPSWSIRLYQWQQTRLELKRINTPDDLLRL